MKRKSETTRSLSCKLVVAMLAGLLSVTLVAEELLNEEKPLIIE